MPVPVGQVRLYLNGNPTSDLVPVDASGNWFVSDTDFPVGTDILTAHFLPGDGNSLPSLSPNLNQVVNNQPQPQPTATTINSTPNPSLQGQAVIVSGNVSYA